MSPVSVPVTVPVYQTPAAKEPLRNPPEPGWTQFVGPDNIYYVAANGNDGWSGKYPKPYPYGSATPTDGPLRTIAAGWNKLGNGKHDWMLLRRGDTWTESLDVNGKSGASPTRPLVIGAYGDNITAARPIWQYPYNPFAPVAFGSQASPGIRNIALLDIHFRPGFSADSNGYGILYRNGGGLLVEGCLFTGSWEPIALDGGSDFTVRRCVFHQTSRLGIYCGPASNIVLEENILVDLGDLAVWPHWDQLGGIYSSAVASNVTVRNNTVISTGYGIHTRTGGTIYNNLLVYTGFSLVIKGTEASPYTDIDSNVVLDSTYPINTQSIDISLEGYSSGYIRNNLCALTSSPGFGEPAGIVLNRAPEGTIGPLEVSGNIVYNHSGPGIKSKTTTLTGISVLNNDFIDTLNADYPIQVAEAGAKSLHSFDNNRVYRADAPPPDSTWLNVGVDVSLNAFNSASYYGAGSAILTSPTGLYPAPDSATLTRYYQSVYPGSNPTWQEVLDEFISQRKGKWKLAWTAEYVNDWMRAKFGK